MNRNIILTGASGAIGQAIAARFFEAGDRLMLAGNTQKKALLKLSEGMNDRVSLFFGDLRTPEACEALLAEADDFFGTPDILINNAGISQVGLCQDATDADDLSILSANLLSCMRLCRGAVDRMVRVKSGRIINISSVWGLYGASTEAAYSATKGGMNAYTKALAKELAPSGIAVNALALGAVDTPMNGHLTPAERESLAEEIPLGRMATPAEVADMVFLTAEAPLYLTGAVIPFDGAWF